MDHSHDHSLFDQSAFMPHGHCYLWQPGLVWTHVISDLLIGLAYFTISVTLYLLVRKIRLPFSPIFIAFGVFIGACGITHFMEIWNLWNADYWAGGVVKVVTATASVLTGGALFRIRPKVIEIVNAARLSEERKVKLESAHAELGALYEKVKESDVLKTQFFANVSHELRTPISLILGPAEELLGRSDLNEKDRAYLDVIFRNAKTLLKQVNDLLDIAKLEAGRLKPTYVQSDIVKLFRFIAAHFETTMQTRGIFFALHAPDSIVAEIDPEKIQRVFMNLLSNAVKFVPDQGRIRVSIQESGGEVVFKIEDTGPGISPDLRDVIFERFRQGDEGVNRKFGGTGLGLAIVKDFVEMHGGTVETVNGQAPGATFVVRIPTRAPVGSTVYEKPEVRETLQKDIIEGTLEELKVYSAVSQEVSGLDASRPTVLVCEDNPDMNRFITETLATEFNVIRAMDGQEGLRKARTHQPDLVVSDIMMPNLSGDELVRQMKADSTMNQIPILLLSARADDDLRIELLRDGASDYVIKPFASEELKARARNLLKMKGARDVLQTALSIKSEDVVGLAEEVSARKRQAEIALDAAKASRLQAERASQAKSMFLNLVSHELNTPISSMLLGIQLLQGKDKDVLTPDQRSIVESLSSSSKTLRGLIDGLLEYVRTGNGNEPKLETIDIGEEFKETVNEFLPISQQKGIELESSFDGPRKFVSDRRKLKIIINNLLVNAFKFTERGTIQLKATATEKEIIISVRDTGIGIAKEDQDRIFSPFERIEPLERKTVPGIGLGLTLVRELVTSLGGTIHLESEAGKGSEFQVTLPLAKP